MSQVSPGWYPDPSGRFAQRYHDGTRWTEHVADAGGQRGVDHVEGGTAPAVDPYAGEPGGQGWGARGGYGAAAAPQAGEGRPTAPPGYDQAGHGPPATPGGFTPTVGLIVAGVGGLLVTVSLFGLDFLEVSFAGRTASTVLEDFSGGDVPIQLDLYASLGRVLGVLVVVGAILAVLRLPQLDGVPNLPTIAAGTCGVFALWHLLAMFTGPSAGAGRMGPDGVDWSPALGAWIGLIGWAALAAGQFLPQRVGDEG